MELMGVLKMIIDTYANGRNKHNQINWINKLKCDNCSNLFEEKKRETLRKIKKKPEHLCPACNKQRMHEASSFRMKKTMANIPIEQRKLISSKAGKKAQLTGKCSASWFTTERWKALSEDEQRQQVMRANEAAIKKLANMTEAEKAEHYRKIMKGCMGFVSKGQQELENSLADLNFKGNITISYMTVDTVNEELKIVIEYNGDFYHCNPSTWKDDEYNKVIKMKAKDKWKADNARYAYLRKMGYYVYIVWESDWKINKTNVLSKIRQIYETRKKEKHRTIDQL
jgi:very-short-patch-repair endonuclease